MTAPDPIPDFLKAVTTATPDPIPDLLKAVNEASGKAFALWITFLTVGIYLAIAIGTTTHLQLLLAGPVKLPLLGVDMPLFAFYGVAPPMFVVLHLYVLMQLYILARLLRLFDDQLRRAKMLEQDRRMTRGQLDKFVFTQFLIGAPQDAIVRLFRTAPGPISPRRANCGVYGIHRNGRVLSRGMRHDCTLHHALDQCGTVPRERTWSSSQAAETARKKETSRCGVDSPAASAATRTDTP